jgi:hypothetical protein
MPRLLLPAFAVLTIAFWFPTPAASETTPDRTQTNHDIQVESGDEVADATCFNCSIHIRGQITGDATTLNGNVVVEEGARVAGDVTTIRGNVHVEDAAQINGDVTTIGGIVYRDPHATVHGGVTSLGGQWIVLILSIPLAILGGIIALIVWLVQRNRNPVPAAV